MTFYSSIVTQKIAHFMNGGLTVGKQIVDFVSQLFHMALEQYCRVTK